MTQQWLSIISIAPKGSNLVNSISRTVLFWWRPAGFLGLIQLWPSKIFHLIIQIQNNEIAACRWNWRRCAERVIQKLTSLHAENIVQQLCMTRFSTQSIGIGLRYRVLVFESSLLYSEISRCMSDMQYSFKGYMLDYASVYRYKRLEALPKKEIKNVCAK